MKTALLSLLLVAAASACLAADPSIIAPVGSVAAVPKADGTVVFIRPLFEELQPYIISAFGAVISALGLYVAAFLKRKADIDISQKMLDDLRKAAETQAGVWMAKASSSAMLDPIDSHSSGIASAANKVIDAMPDTAKALGATPESVSDLVVGAIGKLQAVAASTPGTATATATTSNPDGSSTTVTAKG